MPRKPYFTFSQVDFIMENAHRGAQWLADELGRTRADLYQWGTDNKVSVKKRDYANPKKPSPKFSKWPRSLKWYTYQIKRRRLLTCHYCDAKLEIATAQVDHIIPKVRGGTDTPDNLVIACAECNNIKGTSCYDCPEFRAAIKADK